MPNKKVKCPNCGRSTEYSIENEHRPFCSERCKWIDLGAWASEKYAIPIENATPSESTTDDQSPDADPHSDEKTDPQNDREE